MSKKIKVHVDFGQQFKFFSNHRIIDEDTGKAIVFNTMIDALNYMSARGWEYVQGYVVEVGDQLMYHWMLKADPDKLAGDFKTRNENKGEK